MATLEPDTGDVKNGGAVVDEAKTEAVAAQQERRTCAQCAAWQRLEGEGVDGQVGSCRRRAPSTSDGWPLTLATAWCCEALEPPR